MALPNVSATGLQSLMSDPYRKAVESSLYDPAAADINTTFDKAARSSNELDFARGMGQSTERPRNDAFLEGQRARELAKARATSVLGGGAEARANLGASQGVFSATSDVALRQAQLAQQASQYKQSLAQTQQSQNLGLLASGAGGLAQLLTAPRYTGGLYGQPTTLGGDIAGGIKSGWNSLFPSATDGTGFVGSGAAGGVGSSLSDTLRSGSGGFQDLLASGSIDPALLDSLLQEVTNSGFAVY